MAGSVGAPYHSAVESVWSSWTILRRFLEQIERQLGKARRVWLMDRGVPIEEVLAEMLQPACALT
jgi:hypothetical protein